MPSTKTQKQACCTTCIIPLGMMGFLIWLLIRPKLPAAYVEKFTVVALDETTNSSLHNYTIHYDLRLKNRNYDDVGIDYDGVNVTLYYKPNLNSFPVEIGSTTFSPFYQRKYRSTHRVGSIEARGVRWENVTTPPELYRVELATVVRYRKPLWKGRRHHVLVGADLKVNDQGNLVNEGVQLRSNARRNNKARLEMMGILGILIFIMSW